MTEEDWGRFYSLDDNDGVILPSVSYYQRGMYTGNWADLIIGITYSVQKDENDPADDNEPMVDEQRMNTGSTNLFHFGLSDNKYPPDFMEGQNFLGARGIAGTTAQLIASSEQLTYNQMSRIQTGSVQQLGSMFSMPMRSAHVGDEPFSRFGIRFTFDRHNSILRVNKSQENTLDVTDTNDITSLKTFMQAIPNTTNNAVLFPNFVTTKIFTSLLVYWPFTLNRFKIQCIGAIKME